MECCIRRPTGQDDPPPDPSVGGGGGCCCTNKSATTEPPTPKLPRTSPQKKCRNCCLKLTAFLFSHIGLTFLVAGYSSLGGYIFSKLEKPYEITQRSNVGNIRRLAVNRLWNYTESLNILNEVQWKKKVDERLRNFQLEVFRAVKEAGWDGSDEVSAPHEYQWSFTGALLFSVTVITTIGYGNITPKTVLGRLVTIAYAMIGIPLTLLCLANLGNFLASCFRIFYHRVLCCMCCKNSKRENGTAGIRSEMAPAFLKSEDRNIENGDSKNGNFIDDNLTPKDTVIYTLEEDSNKTPTNIPVLVTLLLLTGYIFCGTLLFTMWEKDWDYMEGSYFCFITLSTIGFGDFVPGTSIDSWHNQSKQIMCALYLLFGLALVAMCFQLMQNQVRDTCVTLGRRIGILKSSD